MKIKRLHALIAFLVLFLSAQALTADSITVAGRFRNITEGMPRTFIINDCEISNSGGKEVLEIDGNGSFCKKIKLIFPHTITVNYNRHFINAFAAPGDSLYMDIDASSSPLSVTFSGDHAELNQQYDPAFQHMSSFINSVNLPSDTVALEEYMPIFKEYVRQGRDSVDSYAREHNLSDEVISMLYSDNLYFLLVDIVEKTQRRNVLFSLIRFLTSSTKRTQR